MPDMMAAITAIQGTPRSPSATLPSGMVTPGTIDLNRRPVVNNADGSHSSEFSVSFRDDKGREILVPTVVNGKFLTPDGKKPPEGSAEEQAMKQRAWQHYLRTGEHMGMFATYQQADAYADTAHNRKYPQSNPYLVPSKIDVMSLLGKK